MQNLSAIEVYLEVAQVDFMLLVIYFTSKDTSAETNGFSMSRVK